MSGEPGEFATLVIVAAGRSERFGGGCKVLELAAGRPLLAWSLRDAECAATVRDVVVVVGERGREQVASLIQDGGWRKPVRIVDGGARRQDSVAAGVGAVAPDAEVVLIHDGARPLAGWSLFDACSMSAREHGACIAAAPVSDTLKLVHEDTIERTVSRSGLWAAQTPQGFRRDVIETAVRQARQSEREFTDEASLLEHMGQAVRIVPGHRSNVKVTVPEDLAMVEALLSIRDHAQAGDLR